MLIKDLLIFVRDKLFLNKQASILMYHSIDNRPEFFAVSPENFRWQMHYLKNRKYNVISLGSLTSLLKGGSPVPPRTVVITFDDGYADNFKEAFPVLKECGFPATIFLTTGLVGNKNYIDKRGARFEMLDWDQILEMHKTGLIAFEPHTVSHPKLSKCSIEMAEKEMRDSKEEIEKRLLKRCDFFAYPFGNYDKKTLELSRKIFKLAITVKRGFISENDNMYELKRNSIDSLVSCTRFKLKI